MATSSAHGSEARCRRGRGSDARDRPLAEAGRAGTVASQGPRYFGFVTGGSIPAAIAADWLVSAWDQNAQMFVMSPIAAVVEQIVADWLKELFGLPATWSVGFVTGAQMANFTALLTARHQLLRQAGWDVERHGLFGAPPIEVVVSDESHRTIFTALRMLGLGAERVSSCRDRCARPDAPGSSRRDPAKRIGTVHRVRADRQRQHRRRRSHRRDRRRSRANAAPGSTWTARSACGRRPVRRGGTCLRTSNRQTRSRPTGTSG